MPGVGGGKGGGGGGGGDFKFTVSGGSQPVAVDAHIEPLTTTSNIAITQPVVTQATSNIAITQPVVTQATSNSDSKASLDLKVEPLDFKLEPVDVKIEPLQITSDSTIDLKPVAVDSCQTIKLGPLPPIHMRQPYSLHFGFTYMGMELFGLNVSSHSETFLNSPPKHPGHEPHGHEQHGCGEHHHNDQPEPPKRSGLRVRLK